MAKAYYVEGEYEEGYINDGEIDFWGYYAIGNTEAEAIANALEEIENDGCESCAANESTIKVRELTGIEADLVFLTFGAIDADNELYNYKDVLNFWEGTMDLITPQAQMAVNVLLLGTETV